jgi:NTE family protein
MREDEERGRQIVVGNLEAMIKLPFSIIFDTYISARYDVGAVWAVPEKIRIADLQHGVGATIGFDTPVGPARFSVGRRFRFLDAPPAVAWGPYLGYFAIGVRL